MNCRILVSGEGSNLPTSQKLKLNAIASNPFYSKAEKAEKIAAFIKSEYIHRGLGILSARTIAEKYIKAIKDPALKIAVLKELSKKDVKGKAYLSKNDLALIASVCLEDSSIGIKPNDIFEKLYDGNIKKIEKFIDYHTQRACRKSPSDFIRLMTPLALKYRNNVKMQRYIYDQASKYSRQNALHWKLSVRDLT